MSAPRMPQWPPTPAMADALNDVVMLHISHAAGYFETPTERLQHFDAILRRKTQ